jgi:hypothetical protein
MGGFVRWNIAPFQWNRGSAVVRLLWREIRSWEGPLWGGPTVAGMKFDLSMWKTIAKYISDVDLSSPPDA